MNQELIDFIYFRDNQLLHVDFITGSIDVHTKTLRVFKDVGSVNADGYVRLWCNRKLRMKHRLVYFLAHNTLPDPGNEIDHYDNNRSNNSLSNIRELLKADNNRACANRKITHMNKETVHKICHLLATTNLSDLTISQMVGRSRGTIRDIKIRRSRVNIASKYTWEHRD